MIKTLLPPIVAALSLSACFSTRGYEADISLLRSYSCKECPEFPFAAEYRREDRHLTYVAAKHEAGLESGTFRLIRREFERLSPQLVVIEGVPAGVGTNHPAFVAQAAVRAESMESYYAASLALGARALFMGGEPSPGDVRDALLSKGFTPRDIVGFSLVLEIPVRKRRPSGETFDEFFRRNVDQKIRMYGLAPAAAMTGAQFRAWYRERNGRDFDPEAVTAQDTAPETGPAALFTQRMDVEMLRVRDARICRVIAEALKKHERVLVVYGGDHFGSQRAVLRRLMGAPVFRPLVPPVSRAK